MVTSAFASENSIRSLTASGEKPPKTTLCGAPIRAQASIATDQLGNHRQVDADHVALADPAVLERVREPLHVAVQVGVGDVALLALLAAPVERHLVALAGLHVAVQAVVRDVQLPVLEPLVERGVRLVQASAGASRTSRGARRPACPEALQIALGLLVDDQSLISACSRNSSGGGKLLHLEERLELSLETLCGREAVRGHSHSFPRSPNPTGPNWPWRSMQPTDEIALCADRSRPRPDKFLTWPRPAGDAESTAEPSPAASTAAGRTPPAQPSGGPRPSPQADGHQARGAADLGDRGRPGACSAPGSSCCCWCRLPSVGGPVCAVGRVHAPDLHPARPFHRWLHVQPPAGGEAT